MSACDETRHREWVKAIVAESPPLTPEQREMALRLLLPGVRAHRARLAEERAALREGRDG